MMLTVVYIRPVKVKRTRKKCPMKATSNNVEAAGRGSLESWLNAAYESLKESGVDAVRVMPLAKKLNLSRTSFYWYFQDLSLIHI